MTVTVGTFNLNNLFSRFNFTAAVSSSGANVVKSTLKLDLNSSDDFRLREFQGKLIKAKKSVDRQRVAERILRTDLDVLAVQEVEDIDTLKRFNSHDLNNLYPYVVLIEGNDPRLIDVGILSKLPIGGVRSWQAAVSQEAPGIPVFSRDLLEVDIFNFTRKRRLFTVFNTHLKSKFNKYNDPIVDQKNDERRRRQATVLKDIVIKVTRPRSRYMILGDMNDTPESFPLEPMVNNGELQLVDGLLNPTETHEFDAGLGEPENARWTHRLRKNGQTHFDLFDQIWLSPSLSQKQTGAFVDRRKRATGDGSDHDLAWVELNV